MRIGWLADRGGTQGGAELTEAEFRAAAPDNVEIVPCPHDALDYECDRYVIHNCVHYTHEALEGLAGKPIAKYWHDVGPWLQPGVRDWLEQHATHLCCSPYQAEHMALAATCIPPAVPLERFEVAAAQVNGNRAGAVCVGSWRNYGKAPHKVMEWAQGGPIDFYGGGPMAPPGSVEVPYDSMPGLLAGYQTFVFLPTVIEPFGRVVAEAWAAGCEIVTNRLVGAAYWINENPHAISTAATDFWATVLD